MKLNPEKCVFGIPAGQLLGFLVSKRGIEENPEKISAIERMEQPAKLKNVQKFTGCLASLRWFVSRLGEKALPLYQLLKKTDKFVWTPEADAAFHDLKRMLSSVPLLAAPAPKELMLLYIAATNRVVSVVLVVERQEEGKAQLVQRPVYYLSEVLSLSKQNYPHYQKLVYGLYMAAKKLKH
jgi:phenylalanine-4-hydroxylase